MKLVTHNFLSSRFLKGAATGYPLILHCAKKELSKADYNPVLVTQMLSKVDYEALLAAAKMIGEQEGLPERLPDADANGVRPLEEQTLRQLHHLLFCVEIVDGELECPDTGRKFPIKDGIPNMLCSEEECI